ncbi:DUF1097 domain-containing protein [Nonomuraea aridisoli]|uniref:DUF1097 domain-containing protein n=1 Tax=Nonomuraea aridisoli TaxID=2070368 RepID=A0A2W2EW85_9ACTN|nr:DUF1097 domain-containing protein [Nonomuraea aridisoli]PZG21109.1 DUF1097 domain-containing protein [Nonomuraea aridisoli]
METRTSTTPATTVARPAAGPFAAFTAIAAVVAAVAAYSSTALGLEAWVMFAGWVAWFTRPTSTRLGIHAVICLWLGMVLAVLGHTIVGLTTPIAGAVALPLAVFVLATVVVGLRTTPVLNNMLAWFLGMVTFFAAEPEHTLPGLLTLIAGSALGAFAGFACQRLQHRFAT